MVCMCRHMQNVFTQCPDWYYTRYWHNNCYFRNPECRKLASSSKDGDVRIWDTVTGVTILSLTGHSKAVTSVKWGGTGLIYTSSQDRTIKVSSK